MGQAIPRLSPVPPRPSPTRIPGPGTFRGVSDFSGWTDYACDGCGQTGRIDGYRREGTPDDSVAAAEIEHFLATDCKGSLRVVRSLPPMPEPPPLRRIWE